MSAEVERPEPARAGLDPERLALVADRFRAQQRRGVFPGGQLVVRRRGVLALDEAVGVARGFRPEEGEAPVPFAPETRSGLFSAGKPLVAMAIAQLESRGQLDVAAPVARYWPEFERQGKADITVLDVLTHRSGLGLGQIEKDWRQYGDWAGIIARIEAAAPSFARGTLAYQPMGFGWILGELIRRVTGSPVERYLEEDVLGPAGLTDLRLGAPREEIPSLARSYWLDETPPSLGGVVMDEFELAQNSVEHLTAVLPGAGTVGTARAIARFYDWILAGTPDRSGAPQIDAAVLAPYIRRQVFGMDKTIGVPIAIGRGFGMGWLPPHPYGWWRTGRCFGHAGNFSTLAWADPTTGCSIAVVTNGNRSPQKLVGRFAPLGSAVRAACLS